VAYYLYASAGTPRRLVSNTLLVARALSKPTILVHKQEFDGGFWTRNARHKENGKKPPAIV
jgi:hypothetical protein